MEVDRNGQFLFMNIEHNEKRTSKDLLKVSRSLLDQYKTVEEEHEQELEIAWDDVLGASLDPNAVRQARRDEIEYVRKMHLYEKV